MTNSAMQQIAAFIATANYEQLEEVARRLKAQRSILSETNVNTLRVGDIVEFAARGLVHGGEVIKINRKTVMVREENFSGMATNWKVPSVMLKKVS